MRFKEKDGTQSTERNSYEMKVFRGVYERRKWVVVMRQRYQYMKEIDRKNENLFRDGEGGGVMIYFPLIKYEMSTVIVE